MYCPSCHSSLKTETIEEVSLNICRKRCGGVWISTAGLRACLRSPRPFLEFLASLGLPSGTVPEETSRFCPVCDSRELSPRIVEGVQTDQCESCWGTWFDAGELHTVAGSKHEVLADKNLSETVADRELAMALARSIASYRKAAEESAEREMEDAYKARDYSDGSSEW